MLSKKKVVSLQFLHKLPCYASSRQAATNTDAVECKRQTEETKRQESGEKNHRSGVWGVGVGSESKVHYLINLTAAV